MPPTIAPLAASSADVALASLQAMQHALQNAYPAALRQSQNLHSLMSQWATRQASNSVSFGALAHLVQDGAIWHELAEMQTAVQQRLQQQQNVWLEGCTALVAQSLQLKRANTLSKMADQQFNLMGQLQALVSTQTTSLLSLQENIEVDYAYWLAQKTKTEAY